MFATLRYDKDDSLVEDRVEWAESKTVMRSACISCRAKKIKCTREKAGCRRCLGRAIPCDYKNSSSSQRYPKSRKNSSAKKDTPEIALVPFQAFSINEDEPQAIQHRPSLSDARYKPPEPQNTELANCNGNNATEGVSDVVGNHDIDHNMGTFEWQDEGLFNFSDFSSDPWIARCLQSPELPVYDFVNAQTTSLYTPSRNNHQVADIQCECSNSAVSLLEAVTVEEVQAILATVPRTLCLCKTTLVQCRKLFNCSRCSTASNFLMLLVVLCQRMMSTYEKVIAMLTEQYEKTHPLLTTAPQGEGMRCERGAPLILRGYEMDPEEEPCVFGGLVTLQLGTLTVFLARLKTALSALGCNTHVSILESVWYRAKERLHYCTSRCAQDAV